jgi:hypothetical protein
VIFCLPAWTRYISEKQAVDRLRILTVPAGLDRSFNVPDALDGHAVLIIAIDHLILELADFID